MTKKLTATQIEGYKRNAISANNNNKNNQPKITMKFYSAALLAIGAIAIKLKEEGSQGEGEGDFPYPEPDCGPRPEDRDGMSPEEHFDAADKSGNGQIDAKEGFEALYCAVVWGEMEEDEARWLYKYLGEHAGIDDNEEELSKDEAKKAFETLEKLKQENDKRAAEGKRKLPFPPPDCGEPPAGIDQRPSAADAFALIDQDGSQSLDAEEGYEAFYCLVDWGAMTEDEAFAAFDFIGSFAGENDQIEIGELEEAFKAMDEMSEEEIAARVEGASMAE